MGVSEFKKDHGSYMSEQTYWTLWDGCRALQTIIPRLLFSTFNLALKSRHPSYYISPPRIFHSMNGTKNHWRLKIPFKTGESTKSKLAGIRPRTVIICISTTNSSSQNTCRLAFGDNVYATNFRHFPFTILLQFTTHGMPNHNNHHHVTS